MRQEIPEAPYRRTRDLLDTSGERINFEDYYYSELMLESALFMLTTMLRRIFVEGLFDEVRDPEKWRLKMKLYEHRYEETGGPKAVKGRGP